jgi:hypothetical protein
MYSPVAGDVCDADFDETNSVSIRDFGAFSQCQGKPVPYEDPDTHAPLGPRFDPKCQESDFDKSGNVTILDWGAFRQLFFLSGKGLPCPGGACPF